MRATIMYGPGDVRVESVPDSILIEPTDAIIRVTVASVCGSDLWPFRGYDEFPENGLPMGHEAIGIVEAIGSDVRHIKVGDVVAMPFAYSDGTCPHCRAGIHTSCVHGGFFHGNHETGGAQAEAILKTHTGRAPPACPVSRDNLLLP